MTIIANQLKHKLSLDFSTYCLSIRITGTMDIVMMARTAGYDAFYVDLEHGSLSVEAVRQLFLAGLMHGITPLVRVPTLEPFFAARMLELGAQGVIVPHIQEPDDLLPLLQACRTAPTGTRTLAGPSPHFGYASARSPELEQALDDETLVIAMLESNRAVGNASVIAAMQGVDMLMLGTNDFLADNRIPGQYRHPAVASALYTLAEACNSQGKTQGLAGIKNDPALLQDIKARGVRFMSVGTDNALLMSAMVRNVEDTAG